MKRCPSCRKTYDDEKSLICQYDGTPLLETTSIGEAQAGAGIETLVVVTEEVHTVPSQTNVRTVISNRPFLIALVNFGEIPGVSLDKLAKDLNHTQKHTPKLFQFQAISGPTSLGPYDLPHNYSNAKLFGFITESFEGTGINYGIAITVEELELARFNSHDESLGVGLVTVYNHDEYKPPEKTLYQYLAYLILCEAFCITGRCHFEHDDKHYCLFDECSNKKDLRLCLEHPKIHCISNLENIGFSKIDVANAKDILAYVRKRSPKNALLKTFGNPVVGILLGGGSVNLLAGTIFTLPGLWRFSITGVLFFGIFIFFALNYVQPKKGE